MTDLEPLLRRLLGPSIEMHIALEPRAPNVLADRSQVEQILINLVANARDAMPAGGRLSIETARDEEYVTLVVEDTGVGMDERTRVRIFEPFFTTKGQGRGLGLSTVDSIVRQSGGTLDIESTPGLGTRFTIALPATETPVEKSVEAAVAEARVGRILVVDDEPAIRTLVEVTLAQAGHAPTVAATAEQALELLGRLEIDVLIADVVMPVMSGIELAARAQAEHPDLSVILVTGLPEAALEGAGDSDASVTVLGKPFSPAELVAKVSEILAA